jgi:cytidylate kinase
MSSLIIAIDGPSGAGKGTVARAVARLLGERVAIDELDVTRLIRTPEIDAAAAAVARLPLVRSVLVSRQRALGREGRLVMEGRDIGTVVFPQADVKIYLDAAADERARRRASDPAHSGVAMRLSEVANLMSERDRLDLTRAASPLVMAPDAEFIDTTERSVDEVVASVIEAIRRRSA